ncbi:unnamed protein product [Spirodela intermedia]|uniref:Uncharacterized protein n=1 Tax=Spirodela intermedia TaxID=51605 RepID=A0A7I8L5R3_SPIIN|nr:unnamed protein product [Spirodela intermedia]
MGNRLARGETKKKPGGAVRIKVLLSRKELAEMMSGGAPSPEQMIAMLRRRAAAEDRGRTAAVWRPALESIPEGKDPF